jgi:hypothetical protein
MTSFKPQNTSTHQPSAHHPHQHHPKPVVHAVNGGHTPQGCEESVHEYLSLLGQQRALLGELDALSQRQSMLIDEPVLDPLIAVLEERQGVIDRITQTSRTAEQLRPQWEQMREHVPEAHRRRVEQEQEAVGALAEQVQKRDDRDHARLKQRLEGVTAELAGLATSKKAASAYSPQQTTLPRFQDRKG